MGIVCFDAGGCAVRVLAREALGYLGSVAKRVTVGRGCRGCWLQIHGDPIEVIFRVLEPAEMEPAFTTTIPEDMWIQRGTSEVSKQKLAQKS